MAAPTNTVTSLVSIGNREDLSDIIYRVAPEDTPFVSNIGKAQATGTYHEWQTETLASVTVNAQLEGNTFAIAAGNLTSRVGNYCQILTKAWGVSRTEDVVKKAGRVSETNRQKVLKGIECRRDLEYSLIGNNPSRAESGANARLAGGALAWCVTNTSKGSGGSDGGWASNVVSAATNGTQRALTETLVKSVMSTAFQNGAHLSQAYMGPVQKQEFSAFTGIANLRKDVPGTEMAVIIGAADVYVSDFGNLQLIPHPYGLTRDVLLIDPKMLAVATLDGWKTTPIANTADSDQYAITYEGTLEMRNEKAAAAIRDLN
jgi:Family of unknown function (DUF5309)